MKKHLFFFAFILFFIFSASAQEEGYDHVRVRNLHIARTQESAKTAISLLYNGLNDFDRECFLIGTMNDDMGHYQTFTSNKSIDDIDDYVKWMFEQDPASFEPDTMACQRITSYADLWGDEGTALLAVALFKKDYPDLRAVRTCICLCKSQRKLYGTEIVTYSNPDSICDRKSAIREKPFEIELHSSSLARVIAGYYKFDFSKLSFPIMSSGGDIAYRGVINKDKISTPTQRLSFLAGVFMRYQLLLGLDMPDVERISMPNSVSAIELCAEILREIGCEHVTPIYRFPDGYQILFTPSDDAKKIINLINKVSLEMDSNMVIF
jgi:hypothetical protein